MRRRRAARDHVSSAVASMDCTIGTASSTARNEPLILIEDELKPAPPKRSVLSSILSSDMPDSCVVVSAG